MNSSKYFYPRQTWINMSKIEGFKCNGSVTVVNAPVYEFVVPVAAVTANPDTDKISVEELNQRRNNWVLPKLKVERGVLFKYAKQVSSASKGCVTDVF